MPTYEVQQYELHVLTHKIEADDEASAVAKLYKGEGEPVSFEFAGIADDFGMSVCENGELADRPSTWASSKATTTSFRQSEASSR